MPDFKILENALSGIFHLAILGFGNLFYESTQRSDSMTEYPVKLPPDLAFLIAEAVEDSAGRKRSRDPSYQAISGRRADR